MGFGKKKTALRCLLVVRGRFPKIGTKLMAGKPSDAGYIRHALGWDLLPHHHGATVYPELTSNLGHEAPPTAEKRYAGWLHATMLSTPERLLSTRILQDGLAQAEAACGAMEIANRIKTGRKMAQMSQRVLAERMAVSPSAVAQWETGGTSPSIANRVDLARILKIPFVDLVPEAGRISEMALRDPLILAIIRQVLRLPEAVQQALLMQLSATAEALDNSDSMDDKLAG